MTQIVTVNETDFQQQVIDAAHLLGWRCAHFRGVRVQRKDGTIHYQTPVQADGEGFPDLVLVNPSLRRVLYVELKSDIGKMSPAQVAWQILLERAGQEFYLWKPRDWDKLIEILRGKN
jgi:hypothetical protein